ncbi:molybdopterin-dependent oxidoreductase [Tindallia californiensis]|uniref:Formate dehydrogenase major subunit n=1 Tax=Tindallia californiensis TaxID=159292 RepID=A0A1H3MUN6_9FIRM|nr:molybdopterin-dependent oxidoreductase [Tindallia californiensis]SDY80283.1 formate dehydrogenase major subunit [Tindallia californiensis]
MSVIRLNINGKEVTGQHGQTILQVARANGIEIPTLCYDERMEIYGSCGLCIVEVEGIPKLLRACATEISQDMVIKTNSKTIKANRKIALELLLTDHTGDCRPPCVLECPGKTDCQGYVGLIANGEYKESLKLIKEQLPLPASIGRVCPHPCEDACRRELKDEPVAIAWHKRFVADIDLQDPEVFIPEIKESSGKKVAIVGGGPGGLSTAYYLLQEGHEVTIYDMMPEMGGMLKYGIPQYRLPKDVLNQEIGIIEKMGAQMINNVRIGQDLTLDYLRTNNDAVYLSIGCWESSPMKCKGEDLEGVIGGIHFLRDVVENKPIKIGKKVAVIGGGNTAMDACRTAVRLGADEVYNLYRRTRGEMPAEEIEIVEAEEEGVIFKFLVSPLEVIGENGRVQKIRLQKMELGEPDASGRRRPVPIEGEEEILELDSVIVAIGQYVNVEGFEALERTKWDTIISDEKTFSTSIPGIFAGGDAINDNLKIAIQAIGDGKIASKVIHEYVNGVQVRYEKPYLVTRKAEDIKVEEFAHRETANRPPMAHLSPEFRRQNFEEVGLGFTPEQAVEDAKRCLECGCHDYFECKLLEYANDYHVEPDRLAGEMHQRQAENSHPFIDRNPDKCILCGLCVRVCQEVMDITALGLVDRGFDTIVKPAMDRPLKDTDCISCGQCVDVCPTGALQERLLIEKSVPVEAHQVDTVCGYCSVGCEQTLEVCGNMLVRSLPKLDSPSSGGLLCVKGRFGFDMAQKNQRITTPMIRKDGELVEASWDEALLLVAKKAQGIGFQNGADSIALTVSDHWTNEEIYTAKRLAHEVLHTPWLGSLNRKNGGLQDVLGIDASPNTLEEVLRTQVILLIGSQIMRDHAMAGVKVRKAVQENGAQLITVNPEKTKADEWATINVTPENQLSFLKEIAASLIEKGCNPAAVEGFEALKENLKDVKPSTEAAKIAAIYSDAKSAMIVFDSKTLTSEAEVMLANIAVLAGQIGAPRKGLLKLQPQNNSQALPLLGIHKDAAAILDSIRAGHLKGLLLLGEDLPAQELKSLDFLMVMDSHLTETAKMADVFLPAAIHAETEGTYTSFERRLQPLTNVLEPAQTMKNWEVLTKIAAILRKPFDYGTTAAITADLAVNTPGYQGLQSLTEEPTFWPLNESPVLYTEGFGFEDGKARLQIPSDASIFEKQLSTHYITNLFMKKLEAEGLDRH